MQAGQKSSSHSVLLPPCLTMVSVIHQTPLESKGAPGDVVPRGHFLAQSKAENGGWQEVRNDPGCHFQVQSQG